MALSASEILPLVRLMALSPRDLIALPTTIEVAARKAGLSQFALVRECMVNAPLREYLAGICRNAASEVAA